MSRPQWLRIAIQNVMLMMLMMMMMLMMLTMLMMRGGWRRWREVDGVWWDGFQKCEEGGWGGCVIELLFDSYENWRSSHLLWQLCSPNPNSFDLALRTGALAVWIVLVWSGLVGDIAIFGVGWAVQPWNINSTTGLTSWPWLIGKYWYRKDKYIIIKFRCWIY